MRYLIQFASYPVFLKTSQYILPFATIGAILCLIYGVISGLWFAPADYLQGEGFRIIYVHVPCAIFSLFCYSVMAFGSFLYLIWRIKLADKLAYHSAIMGTIFTALALITGSIWGKPMWGTWWMWDARLTSELILFFIYIGYIGLRQAIPDEKASAKAAGIFALIGFVDIPIIHFSVNWWNTLHQNASITRFAKPAIEASMLYPLLSMITGFLLFFIALIILNLKTDILKENKKKRIYYE